MFDEDRLAGVVEAQLAGAGGEVFGGFEAVSFFLSDADKDRRIANGTSAAHLLSDRVFALAFLEGHDWNLMLLNVRLDLGNIVLADLAQEGGRGHGKLQMVHQEADDSGAGLEAGDVAIEVEPV